MAVLSFMPPLTYLNACAYLDTVPNWRLTPLFIALALVGSWFVGRMMLPPSRKRLVKLIERRRRYV